jgi:hypothetical protein
MIQFKTEEKYSVKWGRTYLTVSVYAIDGLEKTLLESKKFKLPKYVPTYLTKYQLWQHTDYQLLELQALLKRKGRSKPTPADLAEWKSWLAKNPQ